LLRWQRQHSKVKVEIWSYGLAIIVSRNPRTTSVCMVHGSTPLCISCAKNPRAKGSFQVSDTCDKEFNRMAQTFGMIVEYAWLKGETGHNVLPDVGRSLPD
jgi:hypothetical protein